MRHTFPGYMVMLALLMALGGCAVEQDVIDLGRLGAGKADLHGFENMPIVIQPNDSALLKLEADVAFVVLVSQQEDLQISAAVSVEGGAIVAQSQPATSVSLQVEAPVQAPEQVQTYMVTVQNHDPVRVFSGLISVTTGEARKSEQPFPTLEDPVRMENEYCVYSNTMPYLKQVKWQHPEIKAALRGLGPGYRSTFSYSEWRKAYGLESTNSLSGTAERDAVARNFIRVLCGEYRDLPAMIKRKLAVVSNQVYAGSHEMQGVDTTKNLFSQITYPAYQRMIDVMYKMHSYRQEQLSQQCQADSVCQSKIGYNYNFGEMGHNCNRVQRSVPPWTHCEMKFIFETFMVDGAPTIKEWGWFNSVTPAEYEQQYAQYKQTHCVPEDLEWMYNFRGHVNFKPLWLESNAFIWNSRRARKVAINHPSQDRRHDYYLRPFASRYLRGRKALATYLFYPEQDHDAFRQASESGGGPILYLTDQDTDQDNLSDYRLFAELGCGDNGVSNAYPDSNCNMVSWETAASTPSTTGHLSSWDPELFWTPDMGFNAALPSFEQRMSRFNQALDRHSNWGPTGYYMIDAAKVGASPIQVPWIATYSPIVACSYDISASSSFATRDFSSTDPFEQGKSKWMFVMRFPAKHYYSELDMQQGTSFDFNTTFFNETSLSNDNYNERALDRFGFVPAENIHANIYFVYGDRGEPPPALEDIPTP